MRYVRARFEPNSTRFISLFPHQLHLELEDEKLTICGSRLISLRSEVIEWCNDTFGVSFQEWAYYTGGKNLKLYFKTKGDALAFKIMWS